VFRASPMTHSSDPCQIASPQETLGIVASKWGVIGNYPPPDPDPRPSTSRDKGEQPLKWTDWIDEQYSVAEGPKCRK